VTDNNDARWKPEIKKFRFVCLIFIQEDNIDGFVRGSSIIFFLSSVQAVYAEDQASCPLLPPKTSDWEGESDY
jgi:hypothetical protein